ncbi:MAG: peptidylprolyl isomerase [Candidatus Omnitrophica bacterium]|nr:peptidylprolyl isomerase [Candidatus Omnitrophota bacterium]
MKQVRFPLIFIFISFLSAASLVHAAEVLERILAVVNDEVVTERDLDTAMAPVVAQFRTMYAAKEFEEKIKEARQDFLRKIIEDKLILTEAKRRQVIVKDEEVDESLDQVRAKFPNRETFLKAIEEQGLTEKKLWDRFRDQLMTQKLVDYEVRSRISVSPGEVSDYYKARPEEFAQADRVRLQHILVRVGTRPEADAKEFADELATQIRQGKDFEELARSYSEGAEAREGGQMGWVEKGQLLGEIDARVFTLDEQQITEPLKSTLGYHIFKVVEKQKFSVKPLTEVRGQIQTKLFKDKLRTRLEAWIQNLKQNAYISIR